jgi:GT2 family glycosyltransferase
MMGSHMAMSEKKILCVILHFGSENDTWACVGSLLGYNYLDIVVSDNDPAQSIEAPDQLKYRVRIYRTGGSAGFSAGNNMAVGACRNESHDSVLILNNDTIALPGSLDKLRLLLAQDGVGAVGPCMPYLSDPKKIWACGGYINKFRIRIGGVRPSKATTFFDVDYLPGAAILCSLIVWDQVGGLPEKYFLAYEEAEFALRIKKLNLRILVDPNAKILHKVGMTSESRPHYIYNGVRNRIKFGQFIWGRFIGAVLAVCMTFLNIRSVSTFNLWFLAVKDEFFGVPLNREALLLVKERYE